MFLCTPCVFSGQRKKTRTTSLKSKSGTALWAIWTLMVDTDALNSILCVIRQSISENANGNTCQTTIVYVAKASWRTFIRQANKEIQSKDLMADLTALWLNSLLINLSIGYVIYGRFERHLGEADQVGDWHVSWLQSDRAARDETTVVRFRCSLTFKRSSRFHVNGAKFARCTSIFPRSIEWLHWWQASAQHSDYG